MDIRKEWSVVETKVVINFDYEIKISFHISYVQFCFSVGEFNSFAQHLDSLVKHILEGERKVLRFGNLRIEVLENGILFVKSNQTIVLDLTTLWVLQDKLMEMLIHIGLIESNIPIFKKINDKLVAWLKTVQFNEDTIDHFKLLGLDKKLVSGIKSDLNVEQIFEIVSSNHQFLKKQVEKSQVKQKTEDKEKVKEPAGQHQPIQQEIQRKPLIEQPKSIKRKIQTLTKPKVVVKFRKFEKIDLKKVEDE